MIEPFQNAWVLKRTSQVLEWPKHPSTIIPPPANWIYSPTNAYGYNTIYGLDKFVQIPRGGSQIGSYSYDGLTWSTFTMPGSSLLVWTAIAYSNNMFIATASTGSPGTTTYAYSSDGITWSLGTLPGAGRYSGVAYGNGVWVIINQDSGTYYTSTNGISWTSRTYNSIGWKVKFVNDRFITWSLFNVFASYSIDGINWLPMVFLNAQTYVSQNGIFTGVSYGNGKYVFALGGNGTSSYCGISTDGINITAQSLGGTATQWISTEYGNNYFVIVSASSTRSVISSDTINWSDRIMLTVAGGFGLAYNNKKFIRDGIGGLEPIQYLKTF